MRKIVRFEDGERVIQIGADDALVEIQVRSDTGDGGHQGVRTAAIWLTALGARQIARAIEEAADVAEKVVQREMEDTEADHASRGRKP